LLLSINVLDTQIAGAENEIGQGMSESREMLIDAASGMRRPVIRQEPELVSDGAIWPSIHVEQHRVGALEIAPASPLNHILVVHLEGACDIEIADAEGFRTHRCSPGQISLFPAGVTFAARSRDAGRFYSVSLTSQFVINHGIAPDDGTIPEFQSLRAVADPVLKALCDRIRDEVLSGVPEGRVYVESLGQALAAHLTRHYAKSRASEGGVRGLTSHQLRRAVEFIRDNLASDISLATIARAADLSPFHFARRFKLATGVAPHQYLIRQRIDRAKHLLAHGRTPLSEIAHQCGFCDQSHLTNHFRRATGVTPRRYRDRLGQ